MAARRGVWAFVLIITIVGIAVFAAALALRGPRTRNHAPAAPAVLVWNVPSTIVEGEPPHRLFGMDWLRRSQPSVLDIVRALDRAATDHHVRALVLHIDRLDWGWGKLAEVRDAVARVRRLGKPVYAIVESGGDAEYFLASVAGVVALPPAAVLQVNGLMASAMFFKGTFDKLDVHPNFAHAGQYKSAAESYTRQDMSGPSREAMDALLDDIYGVLVDSLASARGLTPDSVRALIDSGPYPAGLALERGLVDTLLYAPDVDSLAVLDTGDRTDTESFTRYAGRPGWSESHVAYVAAAGTIAEGRSRFVAMGDMVLGSETFCATLRDLREDESIRAVVLRVDSPGGDAQASDEMWREVERLNAVKPVVVSMSDLAASGGYYLSAGARRIVAQPSTLTGSIGVFGGKLNILGLYHKLGLNVETLQRGRNAGMMSEVKDFDPSEAAAFQAQIDTTYRLFLRRVSDGRAIDLVMADSVGRGRVWSGRAAVTHGLVDTLGGIRVAYRLAARAAGIAPRATIDLQEFPHARRTFIDVLLDAWYPDDEDGEARGPAAALLQTLPPVAHAWLTAAAFPAGRTLTLLPWSITIR